MSICRKDFGRLPDGRSADLFELKNKNGMIVGITNIGAAIVSITVPDRGGSFADVVLGYDSAEKYLTKGAYHGVCVGRVANRIEDARFELNGREYNLKPNYEGRHMLHGGETGLDTRLFAAALLNQNTLELSCVLPDGEDGFPGEVALTVLYTLTDENALSLRFIATCDSDTVINLINHAYFNLNGHDSGSITDHELMIFSDKYTPLNDAGMVYGEIRSVEPEMDFRNPKKIGRDIDSDFKQLKIAGGYDHNYMLDAAGGDLTHAAGVYEEVSGRAMDVYTNSPAILLYTGNHLDKHRVSGKGGVYYKSRGGFCLETNFPPNALKYKTLPQPILRRGEVYDYTTLFKFGVK
ncbi:MAG: galactose mutarotase [Clostridiales bacterium]|jgi:aldose 1-epimerase|nr:galactose mutarotase [Clostridiales bacterium]